MKDAFGGTFMLNILLIFFVIFICFMTVAISITRTFRIKNNVINIIERNDVTDKSDDSEIRHKIESYLTSIKYGYGDKYPDIIRHCNQQQQSDKFNGLVKGYINGVCLVPEGTNDDYYYKVYSYIVIDFPFFHLGTFIPIGGESKKLS